MKHPDFSPDHSGVLPLEAATMEFVADLPFDDRLDQLLEHCESYVRFEAHTDSFLPIDNDYLTPTHLEDGQPHTPLIIHGYFTDNLGVKSLKATFTSPLDIPPVTLDGYDGYYYLNSDRRGVRSIPALDASGFVLRSVGHDPTPLHKLHKQHLAGDKLCQDVMTKALENAASATGTVECRSTLARKSTAIIPGQQTEIRFGYRTIETRQGSELYVVLENATSYLELDAEEAYRLEIAYKNNSSDSEPTCLSTSIQKAVRSDTLTVKSIDLFHTNTLGTCKSLDNTTAGTFQQFVDAFEELLDQTAT